MITIFEKTSFVLVTNANIFAEFFGENIFKIITSVPGHPGSGKLGCLSVLIGRPHE
jgi:hypothetical protein